MLSLHAAFDDFSPEIDAKELSVDGDFITDFLMPYFHDLPREELAAKVAEVILFEQSKHSAALLRRRTVANLRHDC